MKHLLAAPHLSQPHLPRPLKTRPFMRGTEWWTGELM